MTKLTFDVDFNKDPDEILREIQERAKAEVAKRESKIKSAAFLSKLHEKVNEEIGTDYKSINDLIRALTQFANPKLKEKISSTSSSGRRVTISMTRDLFEEIKSKLAQPNPNKAGIARETGASVVQVRKVASGGYDAKFSADSVKQTSASPVKVDKKEDSTQKTPARHQEVEESIPSKEIPEEPSVPKPLLSPPPSEDETPVAEVSPELPPISPLSPEEDVVDEPSPLAPPPAPSLDPAPPPSAPEPVVEEPVVESPSAELPPIAPPSLSEDNADEPAPLVPPPAPSLDLPPPPSAPEPIAPPEPIIEEPVVESPSAELPPIAPPSLGEDIADEPAPLAPPPAPSLDLPPEPSVPEPISQAEPEAPATLPKPSGAPNKPTLSLKPKGNKPGIGGKTGKPTLSLKSGKKKTGGLKITRPPMKPPSA